MPTLGLDPEGRLEVALQPPDRAPDCGGGLRLRRVHTTCQVAMRSRSQSAP